MADCIRSMIFFMTLSFLIWVKQDPCHNAVLGGLWSIKNRWAPYNFFRLFCTSRTCTPKSEKAPFKWNVGSKNIFQSQTRQGPHSFKNSNTFKVVFYPGKLEKISIFAPYWYKQNMMEAKIKQPVTISNLHLSISFTHLLPHQANVSDLPIFLKYLIINLNDSFLV